MQLRHTRTVYAPLDNLSRVSAIAHAPNNQKCAIVTTDRVVHLLDQHAERRDKFSTKPASANGPKTYAVRGMAWSPDSTKLAVAQSDAIVYVYKLGTEWGDKKSICNKFPQSSAVTALVWPPNRPAELVFGTADGKVKVGQLRSNKPATLYPTSSYVAALAASADGSAVVSSHVDGRIYRFRFDEPGQHVELVRHPCVPYALAWGEAICAAGSDQIVCFYEADSGNVVGRFDYSRDETEKEFTVAAFNPSGETVVVGSFNRLRVFGAELQVGTWSERSKIDVENLYTVTALGWKADGSSLAVGSLCGGVDLYDACLRRVRYGGKFEFTYVSASTVIVKRLSTGARFVLRSSYGYEIVRVRVYEDRFVGATTHESLLVGDLDSCELSEVPWAGSGAERFIFDGDKVAMVYNSGELTLIEYGASEVLGKCRTEHVSPHLLSVRLHESRDPASRGEAVKKVAYLLDLQTVIVQDLASGVTVATLAHDSKIDWLDMNGRASKLLFRDKRRALHLFDVATQTRSTLLSFCSYVNWAPGSDVVVAQSRTNLCVWYHIDAAERVTVVPIKGDVEDIERSDGKTEVVVDEGMSTVTYELNEALICFSTAVDEGDYAGACAMLERLELTPETEAMWDKLSNLALARGDIVVAERCFAATGNVARARYLRKVNNLAAAVEAAEGGAAPGSGHGHFSVQAKLAALDSQYARAEQLLLQHGLVEEAMEMYQELHKWDDSIAVAEARGHPEVDTLRANYLQWLTETGQEEKAAELKEREGDIVFAVRLYLSGGLPARAATLLTRYEGREQFAPTLVETVAAALHKGGMFERAGTLFEQLGDAPRAMEAYRKGSAYARAVELSRRAFQGREVVELEEAWGDWLVSRKNSDAAVCHYTEAGAYLKAVKAAITSRQWVKAAQIADTLAPQEAQPFYAVIASHHERSRQYGDAEALYLRAGSPQSAVEMYANASKWELAHRVATQHLGAAEASALYISQAHKLEAASKFKEAERLFIMVREPDLAINMYKKARRYNDMVRLVASYRKEMLTDTHLHLAKVLESESSFKLAERHYADGGEWKAAVQMYRTRGMWEDAVRIAKMHGGPQAPKEVSFAWAVSLGGESGARLLMKFGLLDQAIEYAAETGAFDHAFELCTTARKEKLPEVREKYAMFLEDEGRFAEAEKEFIQASKPKEAIDMYLHQQDWAAATRVAEAADPAAIPDVMCAQAAALAAQQSFTKAEALFVKAKRPERAVEAYKAAQRWNDAMRITKEFLPHRVAELTAEHQAFLRGEMGFASDEALAAPGRALEEGRDFSRAIDAYLSVTAERTRNLDLASSLWDSAVRLAMNHVPERIGEVVATVAQRLIGINRHAQAAELYEGIDATSEAVDAYCAGGLWDAARELARGVAPQMLPAIEARHKDALQSRGAAVELVQAGNVLEGIEAHAQRGEWDACLDLASAQGPEMLARYATLHGAALIQAEDFVAAAGVFAKHGTAIQPASLAMYRRLAKELLTRGAGGGGGSGPPFHALRTMLHRVIAGLNGAGEDTATVREFEDALWIAHLCAAKKAAAAKGDKAADRKLAVARLKYLRLLPADMAFYEAGMACRATGDLDMAFVFLNRFLDITEAVEEHEASSTVLDNSDFVSTEVPHDFPLPEASFLDDAGREQVRDLVLELSMNANVKQALNRPELNQIFSEIKQVADAVSRGGRVPAGTDDIFGVIREAVLQIE